MIAALSSRGSSTAATRSCSVKHGTPDVVDETRLALPRLALQVCHPESLGEAQVGDIPRLKYALAKSPGTGVRPPVANEHGCPMTNLPAPAT